MPSTREGDIFTYPVSFTTQTFAITVSNCDGISGALEDCIARIYDNSNIWLYSYGINFNGNSILITLNNNATYLALGY